MSSPLLRYCPDLYNYQRRETRPVQVGKVQIGGGAPVVVQSGSIAEKTPIAGLFQQSLP